MIYWQLFIAHFVPNLLGYGGGPATIPLLEHEVVDRYGWFTTQEYSEIVALGNGLPGPIATKMAAYIGFDQGGILGAFVATFATVAPSLMLLLMLLGILMKYKESPAVKKLTKVVRPTIAVLLGLMTYDFFFDSYSGIGVVHTTILIIVGYVLLEVRKISPTIVVLAALIYGAVFLGGY
ncbi:chromate transporter [Bhargavaea beijingensis]|uniref:Chromate transporter n=1 Tax=Bhargavaea beijingensis TaxID=426756 RepID=A0A1G6ZXS7_9BACL|nr:chromate transporter [Bhargavaea beijingensis]MCW1927203.1 chromate transporter [Bhargavaea beijingensis]RSK35664.1 chromate transporter [Bhargavaea beijingensis]SDE07047.1 chromate transporter [Bhargavaea beijingensis]